MSSFREHGGTNWHISNVVRLWIVLPLRVSQFSQLLSISTGTEKCLFDFLKFLRCPFVLRQLLKTISTNKQFAVLRVFILIRRFPATIE